MNKGKVRDNERVGRKRKLIDNILKIKKKSKDSEYAKNLKKKSGQRLSEILSRLT